MHNVEKQLGVINVSITDSSLEDVFIAVVLKYDKILDDEEENGGSLRLLTAEDDEEQVIAKNTSFEKQVEKIE